MTEKYDKALEEMHRYAKGYSDKKSKDAIIDLKKHADGEGCQCKNCMQRTLKEYNQTVEFETPLDTDAEQFKYDLKSDARGFKFVRRMKKTDTNWFKEEEDDDDEIQPLLGRPGE